MCTGEKSGGGHCLGVDLWGGPPACPKCVASARSGWVYSPWTPHPPTRGFLRHGGARQSLCAQCNRLESAARPIWPIGGRIGAAELPHVRSPRRLGLPAAPIRQGLAPRPEARRLLRSPPTCPPLPPFLPAPASPGAGPAPPRLLLLRPPPVRLGWASAFGSRGRSQAGRAPRAGGRERGRSAAAGGGRGSERPRPGGASGRRGLARPALAFSAPPPPVGRPAGTRVLGAGGPGPARSLLAQAGRLRRGRGETQRPLWRGSLLQPCAARGGGFGGGGKGGGCLPLRGSFRGAGFLLDSLPSSHSLL